MPLGALVPQTRTSGVENTSSCTSSGNMQTRYVGIQLTIATQATEPSMRPSAVPTSTRVAPSHS